MPPLCQRVHLGGPHCIDAQLVVSIRQNRILHSRVWGPVVYFWRAASTNSNPYGKAD